MFDVGFSELCLIALVSLLVIGPERLPKVARLAGFWVGKTRSMMDSVKEEIKQELQAAELRQIFEEQSALQENFLNEGKNAIAETQQMLDETSATFKDASTSQMNNPEGFWLAKTPGEAASVKEEINQELQDDFLSTGKNAIAEAQQILDETSTTLKDTSTSSTIYDSEQHEPK